MFLLSLRGNSIQSNDSVMLDSLSLATMQQDYGSPHKDRTVDGAPLTVAGVTFDKGIGTHANETFSIGLKGKALKFTTLVGLDDESNSQGSIVFQIWVDEKKVAETPVLKKGMAAIPLSADLTKAKILRIVVTDAGDGINYDHADWINPTIETVAGGSGAIKPFMPPAEKLPKIAHGFSPKPMLHGPKIVGCSANHPFLFKIPATGRAPLTYSAKGLPEGLTLDSATGIISGEVKSAARTTVAITVSGPRGKDSRELVIDSNGNLSLTPPMGWNSWNVWADKIDEQKMKDSAKIIVDSGLASYGYSNVNIDDTWEGPRGSDGIVTTNKKFPDMNELSSYIHGLGLHFGIYSSPGPTTCAGYTASYQFEQQDADTYSKWGVDYLKYDWCSYGSIEPNPDLDALKKPYSLMSSKLKASGRDIIFSLCQYGMGDVWNWGASVGGNCWRCTGDINDSWGSMSTIGFSGSKWANGAGPGAWNDPDMLVVGNLGWGGTPHPTKLTPNEQITHISLWSLLAAPLLIGCDLTHLDAFTKDLLTNNDIIDVDQDSLGKPAVRVSQDGQTEVWARPLADGSRAVGLFNRGDTTTRVTLKFSDLSLSGAHQLRDLWRMKSLGSHTNSYSVDIPRHGAVMLKVS